jgi:hypothetical protein
LNVVDEDSGDELAEKLVGDLRAADHQSAACRSSTQDVTDKERFTDLRLPMQPAAPTGGAMSNYQCAFHALRVALGSGKSGGTCWEWDSLPYPSTSTLPDACQGV